MRERERQSKQERKSGFAIARGERKSEGGREAGRETGREGVRQKEGRIERVRSKGYEHIKL